MQNVDIYLNAKNVFHDLDYADVEFWNSLIAGYALNKHGKEALKLFQDLKF